MVSSMSGQMTRVAILQICHILSSGLVSFRKQLDAILCQSDFDTPSIRASLLKEILHCLPEPLCVNGYSKIFEVIPQMQKYEDKLQLLNLLFLILPRPNQFFLLHLLTLFNKIAENSNVNKMNLRNLAICFAPNFFLSQMSPTKNAPNSKVDSRKYSCLLPISPNNYYFYIRVIKKEKKYIVDKFRIW